MRIKKYIKEIRDNGMYCVKAKKRETSTGTILLEGSVKFFTDDQGKFINEEPFYVEALSTTGYRIMLPESDNYYEEYYDVPSIEAAVKQLNEIYDERIGDP